MATREIKTTIALDGEQSFKNSIKQISKEFRVLDSEMKTISSQYDVTGDKATFLAEKQSLLATKLAGQQNLTSGIRNMLKQMEDAYEDAGRRLDQLRNELTTATEAGNDAEIKRLTEAVKRAETAFAQAASKVQDYQIQLNGSITKENKIQAELNQTQKALEATDREIEELGRDSIRAGRQLEDGIGEGAESAERSVRDLVNTMQEDISSIRTSTAFTAVSGLWDMATGAFSSVSGFVDSTQEYRRQLSFLEQNATTQGYDFSLLKTQLIEVQGLTGDASSAIEGLSNLLAADVDERQMEQAIDNLAGAVISFPDTLKFESLADGLQETIATGAATGQFAELLERLGVNVEEFNTALEESDSAAGDLDIALAYLAANGMEDVYQQWQKTNGALSDAQQTQAALELELAEFGGTLEKYIVTPIKTQMLEALSWVNDVIETGETQGLGAAGEKVKNDFMQATSEGIAEGMVKAAETETGRNILTTGLEIIGAGGPKQWLSNLIFGGISEAEETGKSDARQYTKGFGDVYKDWTNSSFPQLPNPFENITPDQKVIDTLGVQEEWKAQLDAIAIDAQAAQPTIQAAGEGVGNALSTGFESSVEDIEDSGEEAGEAAGQGFEKSAAGFATVARMIGAQIGSNYAAGIESQYGRVMSAGGRLGAAAATGMSRGSSAAGAVAGGIGAAASGAINAVLNIDGKTFARVTAPYLSSALSVSGN